MKLIILLVTYKIKLQRKSRSMLNSRFILVLKFYLNPDKLFWMRKKLIVFNLFIVIYLLLWLVAIKFIFSPKLDNIYLNQSIYFFEF